MYSHFSSIIYLMVYLRYNVEYKESAILQCFIYLCHFLLKIPDEFTICKYTQVHIEEGCLSQKCVGFRKLKSQLVLNQPFEFIIGTLHPFD